jgi:hypothetical protein
MLLKTVLAAPNTDEDSLWADATAAFAVLLRAFSPLETHM